MSHPRDNAVRRSARAGAASLLVGLALVIGAGTLIVAGGACSLGEGVTPDCDPSLPVGQEGACQGKANCDDGKGGVLATEGCCLDASRQLLAICVQRDVADDWRTDCQPNALLTEAVCTVATREMDDKTPNVDVNNATLACDMATDVFEYCLDGGLLFKGVGVGGNGGMGGSGTGGAGGTGAGGAGGMGAGGMGTGGAGGA